MKNSRIVVGLAIGIVAACNGLLGNEEGVLDEGHGKGGNAGDGEAGDSGSTQGGNSGRGGTSGTSGTGGRGGTGAQAGSEGGAPDGTGGATGGDAGAPGEGGMGGTGMGGGGRGGAAGSGNTGGGGAGGAAGSGNTGGGGAGGAGAGAGGTAGSGNTSGGGAGGSGGGCNQVCNSINGTANCSTGTCMLTCTTNFANVDGMGSNGCEVDLRTNEDNCGRVGNDCFIGACSNGVCIGRKLVFATSSAIRGDFGSSSNAFTAADGLCQQLADQAALAGTYRAWLSTASGSPSSRFTKATVPYVRTDGARVAANYTALTGIAGLENPINLDQAGNAVTYTNTWTSTKDNGTYHTGTGSAFGDCTSWTVTSGNGVYGRVTALVGWSQFGGALNCTFTYGLYCFQQ